MKKVVAVAADRGRRRSWHRADLGGGEDHAVMAAKKVKLQVIRPLFL